MHYDCLIIDDEKMLADNTCEYFNLFEVSTKAVYSREEALTFFSEHTTSLILLDINLGDGSGFELCKTIRAKENVPILFISARNTDDDKIIALNIGGDDYIEKPYSLGVLLAKVRVVLKRYGTKQSETVPEKADLKSTSGHREAFGTMGGSGRQEVGQGMLCMDEHLRLDTMNHVLYVDGGEKRLTSLEYTLLHYMMRNPNRLITKTELFDQVWKDKFTSDGTLNVHIRKLREAIEPDPQKPRYIVTVWKEGYKFVTASSGSGEE